MSTRTDADRDHVLAWASLRRRQWAWVAADVLALLSWPALNFPTP